MLPYQALGGSYHEGSQSHHHRTDIKLKEGTPINISIRGVENNMMVLVPEESKGRGRVTSSRGFRNDNDIIFCHSPQNMIHPPLINDDNSQSQMDFSE